MLPARVDRMISRDPARLVGQRQLATAGFGSWRAAKWVEQGLLERVVRGWYRRPGDPVPPTQPLHLAQRYLSRGGHRALITGQAALAMWQVPGHGLPARPTVLVPHDTRLRLADAPFDVLRCRHLADEPVRPTRGLDLVDPARAIADLARDPSRDDRAIRQTVYDVVNRLGANPALLAERWRRIGHDGAQRLLQMAAEAVFDVESEGELTCLRRLFEPHPPLPDCQVWLTDSIRVDFAFLAAALVVEYHGGLHDRSVDRDATRAYALQQLGYLVLVVTRSLLLGADHVAEWIHHERTQRERWIARGELPAPELPPQPPRLRPLRTLPPPG